MIQDTMTYRVYLRNPQQQVSNKTSTDDPAAALAAFRTLVDRTDLDGTDILAVLNKDGQQVAHHFFKLLPDGTPADPSKWWRGKVDQVQIK